MTVELWYRDTLSCLQSTLATLLLHAGEDPLGYLGLGWEFLYLPGDVRPEEFYWPCRHPADLAQSVMPHHPITSQWHVAQEADPIADLEAELAEGRLPLIAVDNFHLPFRPAYQDVHSEHLLVVYDIDRAAGTVSVSDAQPPDFRGPLAMETLRRAWYVGPSTNKQNIFFSRDEGDGTARWISVRLDTPFPALTPERLAEALRANLQRFINPPDERSGLAGLRLFCDVLVEGARGGDGRTLADTYTFGWGPQAQTSLHGELLRERGKAWRLPKLTEAGRHVEHVAHLWTAVRVHSAHNQSRPVEAAGQLVRHTRRLQDAYGHALATVEEAVEELSGVARVRA